MHMKFQRTNKFSEVLILSSTLQVTKTTAYP